jgi:monoamine oxidase
MTDAIIVGAGAAGLAAAALLRQSGVDCLVLEAGSRLGGRAWTTAPDALGGAPFDHGAAWLHGVERNPLAELAQAAGEALRPAGELRARHTRIDGRAATEAEQAAYRAAWENWESTVRTRLDEPQDLSLAAAGAALAGDPWLPAIENWEGALIAAADADVLSLRDWHRNSLTGSDATLSGGLGAFVARRLGALAGPVRLGTPVTRIAWDGYGVRVETPRGTAQVRAAIVTASVGVLAAGRIRFVPGLPAETEAALHGLRMGLLSKVALRAAGTDRLDMPADGPVDRRLTPGEPGMVFQAWPEGRDHMIGFVGGRAAWDLAQAGRTAAIAFAREQARRCFGARADQALSDSAVVTNWGSDSLFLGAYAYAIPGQADARFALSRPQADGRLVFAGEACAPDGLAGTLGGAVLSGRQAARAVLAGLAGPPGAPGRESA